MSKSSTNSIIDKLVEIGTSLGFSAKKEVNFNFFDGYNPRYDVLKVLILFLPKAFQLI